jgi:NTP pyrophosphatase (non-canonical NTP hydrolase)
VPASRLIALPESLSMTDSLDGLGTQLKKFAADRDWEQFHSPKNLSAALAVEAAELLEHFQWLTEDQSRALDTAKLESIGSEVADVLLYLIQLSNALGMDAIAAAQAKLMRNELKYPVDRSRGSAKKYDEL